MTNNNPSKALQKLDARPPVPRIPIRKDPLSKKCAQFDNKEIVKPIRGSMVYIVSNEQGLDSTISQLSRLPKTPQGCHIGFSGWHNFDIMAARLSDRGIICDINPENALFLSNSLNILCTSTNRFDFIKKAEAYAAQYSWDFETPNKEPESTVYFSPYVGDDVCYDQVIYESEQISLQLAISTSWLYTDERFNHIKQLAQSGRIALITENICATAAFSKMRNLLEENSCQIDSVYISNIAYYIPENQKTGFINTVKLLSKDAILIQAPMDLHQQVFVPDTHAQPNWNTLLFAPMPQYGQVTENADLLKALSLGIRSIPLPQAQQQTPPAKFSCGFFTQAIAATVAVSAITAMYSLT